jgi:pyruvate/2-oxoglutarate dehydrogenase complex dihydrolipoamide dehydrogenase (E3) component
MPPAKGIIEHLNEYFINQLKIAGVKVELEKEVTAELIDDIGPDVVILATGASALTPDISGIRRDSALGFADVLNERVEAGERVVVIGGDMVGCETAEFLADKGKRVAIVEIRDKMAGGVNPLARRLLLDRLTDKGVTMVTGVQKEELKDGELLIVGKEGETKVLQADNIVIAAGSKPDTTLFKALDGRVSETYLIGDCVEPRNIKAAIEEGYRVSLTL